MFPSPKPPEDAALSTIRRTWHLASRVIFPLIKNVITFFIQLTACYLKGQFTQITEKKAGIWKAKLLRQRASAALDTIRGCELEQLFELSL